MKRWHVTLCAVVLLITATLAADVTAWSAPVSAASATAAPAAQEGAGTRRYTSPDHRGGVHFGAYTLQSGNRVQGDLVVFGGPVTMEERSELSGDLTVFGTLTMATEATVRGQVVVMGAVEIDGRVEGDIFAAGTLDLGRHARVEGDVATAGRLTRDPGAVVEGEITSVDEHDWNISVPGPSVFPWHWGRRVVASGVSWWMTAFWNMVRAILGVMLMGLLALIVASLWPVQLERIGRVVEEAPLTSFGVGLLTLILASLAAVLLAITICLSPFAFVGMVVVGIGVLLGWIALGLILGQRVLTGLFNQPSSKVVTAAIVGTLLISVILAMSRIFGLFHTLLIFLLVPPAAGAVLLTRFGSMPYATRGTGRTRPGGPSGPSTGSSSGGTPSRPPAPRPVAPSRASEMPRKDANDPVAPHATASDVSETDVADEEMMDAEAIDEIRVEDAVLVES
jgi:cytoskeletal protein CcmA (bactofilin family)